MDLYVFKASLAYRGSSRTDRAMQKVPVSKKESKNIIIIISIPLMRFLSGIQLVLISLHTLIPQVASFTYHTETETAFTLHTRKETMR